MAVIVIGSPNDNAFRGSLYTDNATGDFVFNYHLAIRDTTAAKSYSLDAQVVVPATTPTLTAMEDTKVAQVVTAVASIGVTVPSNRVFLPASRQGT